MIVKFQTQLMVEQATDVVLPHYCKEVAESSVTYRMLDHQGTGLVGRSITRYKSSASLRAEHFISGNLGERGAAFIGIGCVASDKSEWLTARCGIQHLLAGLPEWATIEVKENAQHFDFRNVLSRARRMYDLARQGERTDYPPEAMTLEYWIALCGFEMGAGRHKK